MQVVVAVANTKLRDQVPAEQGAVAQVVLEAEEMQVLELLTPVVAVAEAVAEIAQLLVLRVLAAPALSSCVT